MISKIESTPKRGCCVMNIKLADFVIELGPVVVEKFVIPI